MYSDDSEIENLDPIGEVSSMDDTFIQNSLVGMKINYLNVMVVGASNSGKSHFSKFLFENCFEKKFE